MIAPMRIDTSLCIYPPAERSYFYYLINICPIYACGKKYTITQAALQSIERIVLRRIFALAGIHTFVWRAYIVNAMHTIKSTTLVVPKRKIQLNILYIHASTASTFAYKVSKIGLLPAKAVGILTDCKSAEEKTQKFSLELRDLIKPAGAY
jgi:hypothetical protein